MTMCGHQHREPGARQHSASPTCGKAGRSVPFLWLLGNLRVVALSELHLESHLGPSGDDRCGADFRAMTTWITNEASITLLSPTFAVPRAGPGDVGRKVHVVGLVLGGAMFNSDDG